MKHWLLFAAFVICLLAYGSPVAQTNEINIDVKEQILSNGMTVLVLENHDSPTFSAIIRFRTGAIDERPGITGISHLVEHMMFKGTKIFGTNNYEAEIPILNRVDSLAERMFAEQVRISNPLTYVDSSRYIELRQEIADVQAELSPYVIKDELWDLYLQHGGTGLNASTGNDGTQYYVSLPGNKLELWALLESDRLENIIFREFYSERDVVIEERRLRTENSPWGRLREAAQAGTYWASPYSWPVVGWMSDLHRISRQDIQDYFRVNYSPANAIAVIVGDVKADEVFKMCENYFGKIPAQPLPEPVLTVDAPQMGERRIEIEYDANPIAIISYPTVQIGHPDMAALQVIGNILSRGRTSRFYKNIKEKKLGNVTGGVSETRNPDWFGFNITPMGEHTIGELEEAVYAEIEKLKTEPVTEWELQKVRNQMDASLLRSLNSNRGMMWKLATAKALTGEWDYFRKSFKAIKAVTADDIMRVAKKYFTKKNRTVAFITQVKPESNADEANAQMGGEY